MSVGVMKDYNRKLRDLHVSHTLGCVGNWNTCQEKLFIITEKVRAKERKRYGVGVMKDKELKVEYVKVLHTLS